jgi:hypothetical protein
MPYTASSLFLGPSRRGVTTLRRCATLAAIAVLAGSFCLAVAPGAHAQTVITTVQELQAIGANLDGNFILGNDIEASATATWNNGAGFLPIGRSAAPFKGLLNGNGHVVANLHIKSSAAGVGLFGAVGAGGVVQNLGLVSASITGTTTAFSAVGAVAGTNAGSLANVYMTGEVLANADLDESTGGLVGRNNGVIINSYSLGSVAGADSGGIAGDNFGSVASCFATGTVTGGTGGYRGGGGLVGNNYGIVATSYATGRVSGTLGRVGGLVGFNEFGSISNSYASGSVNGLGTLTSATFSVGGLVGENAGSIATSYSVGAVTGTSSYRIGGLVGLLDSTGHTTNSYWDILASGKTASAGGTGLTTTQLKAALPSGFGAGIWSIIKKVSYPFLTFT